MPAICHELFELLGILQGTRQSKSLPCGTGDAENTHQYNKCRSISDIESRYLLLTNRDRLREIKYWKQKIITTFYKVFRITSLGKT